MRRPPIRLSLPNPPAQNKRLPAADSKFRFAQIATACSISVNFGYDFSGSLSTIRGGIIEKATGPEAMKSFAQKKFRKTEKSP
jgi:hypothetical protein